MTETLEVLSTTREGDALTAALRVPEDLRCLRGHFEGRPVLPGVMQLLTARALATALVGEGRRLARVTRLRFTKPVGPGARLTAELTLHGATVRFVLREGDAVVSSGALGYESAP
ncbi:MAG: hypothetical protein R3A52_16595 [Polyangiales bacterium]